MYVNVNTKDYLEYIVVEVIISSIPLSNLFFINKLFIIYFVWSDITLNKP